MNSQQTTQTTCVVSVLFPLLFKLFLILCKNRQKLCFNQKSAVVIVNHWRLLPKTASALHFNRASHGKFNRLTLNLDNYPCDGIIFISADALVFIVLVVFLFSMECGNLICGFCSFLFVFIVKCRYICRKSNQPNILTQTFNWYEEFIIT